GGGGGGGEQRRAPPTRGGPARGGAVGPTSARGPSAARPAAARAAPGERRVRLPPPMTRGEIVGAVAFSSGVTAVAAGSDWILDGVLPLVDHGTHAGCFLIPAVAATGPVWFLVSPDAAGARCGPALPTLGLRGLD